MNKRTASEIRAYCEAATEGPWVTGPEGGYWPIAKYQPDITGVLKYEEDILATESGNAENDAGFIVNARDDLPLVLDMAVRLREQLRKIVVTQERDHGPLDNSDAIWELIIETVWLAEDDTDG